MERPLGKDVLATLPFREVALPQDRAITVLHGHAIRAFTRNVGDILSILPDEYTQVREHLQTYLASPDERVPSGGVSFRDSQVDFIYGEWGHHTFSDIILRYYVEILPMHMRGEVQDEIEKRNVEVIKVGHLLDLLRMLNPEIASFDKGVEAILTRMRPIMSSTMGFQFMLGIGIDDTINRRKVSKQQVITLNDFDEFADVEGAEQLRAAFLRFASPSEITVFNAGFTASRGQLLAFSNSLDNRFQNN